MGTRGFIGFVIDGTEKIAYNHWDSYPGGLGTDALSWLSTAELDAIGEAARRLRIVPTDSVPTAEDIEQLRRFADVGVGTQSLDDWYVLLRRTQGEPALMLEAGVIEDGSAFPSDSLFAEWGYVVDFDAGMFEVYKGFQTSPHDRGRFAARPVTARDSRLSESYYPCALVASWPLAELPDEKSFMATVDPPEEDDEPEVDATAVEEGADR